MQRFIEFLGKKLSESGHIIIHSTGLADVKIVKATEMMSRKGNTQVIANDTDILVMIIALNFDTQFNVYLRRTKNSSRNDLNILTIRKCMPKMKKKFLLLNHAMTGCDTTSELFNIGKSKLLTCDIFETHHNQSNVFYTPESSLKHIAEAGERIILDLYGGQSYQSLDKFRFEKY